MRWLRRRSERDRRVSFFDAASRHTLFVAVEANELTFLVSTQDESIGRGLFASRSRSEFVILARACERVPARGVFLDIGANIGTTTLSALRSFERVVAAEPEPLNANLLRVNAVLNGLDDRVSVHEAACSSQRGTVELRLSDRKHGGHAVKSAKPGARTIAVTAITLDEIVEREGLDPHDVGLVWVDVEGHEEQVLSGGRSLLDAGVPIVVEARSRTAQSVVRLLDGRYREAVDLRAEQDVAVHELESYLARLPAIAGRTMTDIMLLQGT